MTSNLATGLGERVARVREAIADAAARSGRNAADVTLIAVSKTRPAEAVVEAVVHGIRHVGENRVQEAALKVARVRELLGSAAADAPTWHLIGALQRNKVRQALDLFGLIHSVDSVKLAEALAQRAHVKPVPVLLEVYYGTDANRPGLRPTEVDTALATIGTLPGITLRGLMTVAPLGADGEAARRVFRSLRELRDRLQERHPALTLAELSMGMTNDFPLAIEEGATMVRVGRAIFGERG